LPGSLFDNRKKLVGRVYIYNAAFGNLASDVLERMASTLGVALTAGPADAPTSDDGFDIDVGEDAGAPSYEPIIEALRMRPLRTTRLMS
jgi:hypothetical protein